MPSKFIWRRKNNIHRQITDGEFRDLIVFLFRSLSLFPIFLILLFLLPFPISFLPLFPFTPFSFFFFSSFSLSPFSTFHFFTFHFSLSPVPIALFPLRFPVALWPFPPFLEWLTDFFLLMINKFVFLLLDIIVNQRFLCPALCLLHDRRYVWQRWRPPNAGRTRSRHAGLRQRDVTTKLRLFPWNLQEVQNGRRDPIKVSSCWPYNNIKVGITWSMSTPYKCRTTIFIYTITWLLCAFSLVVDRDLLKDTHRDGVKSTSYHVSGLVFLFSCPKSSNKSFEFLLEKTNR